MPRIIVLCQQLGILEFVEKLPNGFATQLGERGAGLSGRQKQRLAIARALYREPEILMMDEATSALGTASAQHVQQTLRQLQQAGKTSILIAHRLSTVMHADKIVVLAAGKLVEEGTHKQLTFLAAGNASGGIRRPGYHLCQSSNATSENRSKASASGEAFEGLA